MDYGYREIVRLRASGQLADALAKAETSQQAAEEAGDLYHHVKIALERSILELLSARPKRALVHLNWILSLIHSDERARLEELNLVWEMTRAHIAFVDCALDTHDFESAKLLEVLDTGEEFLREVGRPDWRDGLLSVRADILVDLDRVEDATELLREAMEISRVTGDGSPGFRFASYARNLGRLLTELERFDEAEEVLRDLLADPDTSKLDRMAAHVYLGRTLHDMHRDEEAAEQAELGWGLAKDMFEKQRVPALGLMVDVYRALGRRDEARKAAAQILLIARRIDKPSSIFGALLDNADVHMDEGDLARAQAFLMQARPIGEHLDSLTERTKRMDEWRDREERLQELSE